MKALKHLVLGVIRACKQENNDYVLTLKVYQPLCLLILAEESNISLS